MARSSYRSLHALGVAAAAARHGGPRVAAAVSSGDASWFTTPSTRSARIMEVDGRIAEFARELVLADNAKGLTGAPELMTQFNDFRKQWEDWVQGLSIADTFLPSVEDWANRQDEQLERFRAQFTKAGVKTTGAMPYVPPPKPSSSGWLTTALLALAGIGIAGTVLYLARPVVIQSQSKGLG